MEAIISIIIIGSILAGGSTVFFLKVSQANLKLILAFSGAYLLAVTFLTIFPEMYASAVPAVYLGGFVLAGFVLQVLLEFFSHGIEHGHVHLHADHGHSRFYIVSLSLGLYIHSLLEGFPLGVIDRIDHPLLWGIVLHNIPISIAYAWMLKGMHVKPSLLFVYLFIFAVITPAGMLLGELFSGALPTESFEPVALALTTGIFLHISTTILFETGEHHRYNFRKLVVIFAGIGLAMLPHLVE
jgi:zinc transporter ZupT